MSKSPMPRLGNTVPLNLEWVAKRQEPALEPALSIVDPHHHLWDRPDGSVYLLPDLVADVASGHNVEATVYIDCRSMYRADGPVELRPVGETEFANGAAAMSGERPLWSDARLCRHRELCRPCVSGWACETCSRSRSRRAMAASAASAMPPAGTRARRSAAPTPTRRAHHAGRDLARGLRAARPARPHLRRLALPSAARRTGGAGRRLPDTTIILDHVGGPLGYGPYAGRHDEAFADWKKSMAELARHPNVAVKLGGLGMPMGWFAFFEAAEPPSSEMLGPRPGSPGSRTCIELFGAHRCMFREQFSGRQVELRLRRVVERLQSA